MNISGSGRISAGEYNTDVSISGSGRIDGNIRCLSFSCSGAAKGIGGIEVIEDIRISGAGHFDGDILAKNISVSGSLNNDGSITAKDKLKISGSVKCDKNLRCNIMLCSGRVSVGKDIEAEEATIRGQIECSGLLNAGKVCIELDASSDCRIGAIGGEEIKISKKEKNAAIRLPLLSSLLNKNTKLVIKEIIEGDIVAIEHVNCPTVVGRIVAIGEDCEIDLVQYSDEIEIHPNATVKKFEKI